MKTSELTSAALDWAVAKCEGYEYELVLGIRGVTMSGSNTMGGFPWLLPRAIRKINQPSAMPLQNYNPSTNWSQGGPIIEREEIVLVNPTFGYFYTEYPWLAFIQGCTGEVFETGDTPLIAAMRCYVASKLGDEVEIPTELSSN